MVIKTLIRCFFLLPWLIPLIHLDGLSGAERTVERLTHDLKSPSEARRKEAAKTLGDQKIQAALPALMEAANDPSDSVRKEVIIALDKIRDPKAIPTLIRLLNDSNPDLGRRSISALVNLYVVRETGLIAGTKRVIDKLNPLSSAEDNLIVEPYTEVDPSVISALKERLSDSDTGVREDAARALGILRGRQAIPEMMAALKREESSQVKVALIESLYKINDPSVGPELIPLIYDPNKRVHDEAILTLGAFKIRQAVPELTQLYESGVSERKKVMKVVPASTSEDLQWKALQALAMIADKSSEDLFVKALRHPNAKFRQAGAEGLARMGGAEHVTEISRERLREKSGPVKLAESFALYRMGRKEYLDDLVHGLSSVALNDQAAAYLEEFKDKERDDLYPYLRSKSGKVRERLAEVLGRVGDEAAVSQLQPLTKDRNANVASAAVQAIRRIEARARTQEAKNPDRRESKN